MLLPDIENFPLIPTKLLIFYCQMFQMVPPALDFQEFTQYMQLLCRPHLPPKCTATLHIVGKSPPYLVSDTHAYWACISIIIGNLAFGGRCTILVWCGAPKICDLPIVMWNTTFVPGGAIGVQLKPNAPHIMMYYDSVGFMPSGRSNFNIRSVWSRRRSHKYNRKLASMLLKTIKKQFSTLW